MPIIATAQPAGSPPSNLIRVSSSDGSAITACALNRTTNGATGPVRVQPAPGPSPLQVYDYEALWDTASVYTASLTRADGTVETVSSAPVTLTSAYPWLTHPTTPALSMVLDRGIYSAMGVVSIADETRAALTTKHRILGAEYQIVTKNGPRAAAATQMVISTTSSSERAGLTALIRDQTPILIQFPASWGWDFDAGYYDIGDVQTARLMQYGPEPRRLVTMPLERVAAPAGGQAAVRTWANVLAQNATWSSLVASYATWTDVLTDSRR